MLELMIENYMKLCKSNLIHGSIQFEKLVVAKFGL